MERESQRGSRDQRRLWREMATLSLSLSPPPPFSGWQAAGRESQRERALAGLLEKGPSETPQNPCPISSRFSSHLLPPPSLSLAAAAAAAVAVQVSLNDELMKTTPFFSKRKKKTPRFLIFTSDLMSFIVFWFEIIS